MHLIRFFVRIRGARTPPPRIDDPVTKIPLQQEATLGHATESQENQSFDEPACTENTKAYAETNPNHCPRVRTGLLKEAANIEDLRVARSCKARFVSSREAKEVREGWEVPEYRTYSHIKRKKKVGYDTKA